MIDMVPADFLLVERVVLVTAHIFGLDRHILDIAQVAGGVVVVLCIPHRVGGIPGRCALCPAGTTVGSRTHSSAVLGGEGFPRAWSRRAFLILRCPGVVLKGRCESQGALATSAVGAPHTSAIGGEGCIVRCSDHYPDCFRVGWAYDVRCHEQVGNDIAVQVFVRNSVVGAAGARQADTEAVFHQRMIVDDFTCDLGCILECLLVVSVLDAESQICLGKEHACRSLACASVLGFHVPRQAFIGFLQV